MKDPIIQTPRCCLFPFEETDLRDAASFLQDPEVMYAWERTFTDEEILQSIRDCKQEQSRNGFSIMMARHRDTHEPIGRAGVRKDALHGKPVIEIAYMLAKRFWGQGYATELADACINFAFQTLKEDIVYAEVRPTNKASIAVLHRLGMKPDKPAIKIYGGIPMAMLTFTITRQDYFANKDPLRK